MSLQEITERVCGRPVDSRVDEAWSMSCILDESQSVDAVQVQVFLLGQNWPAVLAESKIFPILP